MSTTQPLDLRRYGVLPRSLYVEANGATLHLLEWGDPAAQPVLMVHGMRGHARWFTPVGPAVGERYRALSLDLRGHGESENTGPYGNETFADDVVALVDAMGLERPILVGHSMGGSIMLRAASRLGDRVHALVMVDSSLGPPPLPLWRMWWWRLRFRLGYPPAWHGPRGRGPEGGRGHGWRPERRSRPRAPGERAIFPTREASRASFKLRPGETVASRELLDHLADHAIEELPDGTFSWRFDPGMGMGRPPMGRATRRMFGDPRALRCPVVLIMGEESMMSRTFDAERSRRMFRSAPTEIEVIPGAHHHVFLDQPEAFNEVLLRHLNRLTSG